MATSNGPVQNRGQIRWWYAIDGYSPSASSVTVQVDAYFYQDSWSQQYNGSKSWSGYWGSGSGGQAFFLGPGQQVRVVTSGKISVPLTDSARVIQFSVSTSHFYGSTGSTLSVSIPAKYASTPGSLLAVRESDSAVRLNWSRTSTYSAVVVQRSTNGAAWQQIARPTGNAYTYTDTTTSAGNRYEYRVAGVGGGGQSGWSNTATAYTSPLAPTGVTAVRDGVNIVVDASGRPAHATSYNIRDGATTVATGVSLPWTHTSPAASQVHQYTVQGVVAGLAGAWSQPSNAVQLISKPLAPIGLSPNGGVTVAGEATLFKWKHNPVDSSAQTSAELRYRKTGTTAWVTGTTTTAQQYAQVLAAAGWEWQVRTKGAHADWSDWSAIATVTTIDRPGVAVTSPGELWIRRTVTVEWSWNQAQGRPQSAWEAVLHGPDGELERKTGTGATRKVDFTTKVADNTEYSVTVRAATGDVWSEPAEQWFTVQVPPAAPANVEASWSEDTGSVTVSVSEGRGPERASVTNHFTNSRFAGDGTWVEVRKNLARDSSFKTLAKKIGTATNNMPSGGGAALTISSDWAVEGGTSLQVGPGNTSSAAYTNWSGGPTEGAGLDLWGGKTYTVAATVRRDAVAGDLSPSANTQPRAIVVGLNIGGTIQWVHAKSESAPDTVGEDRLIVTFTLPVGTSADSWFIRLFNGSATRSVWWDALTIEEGVTDGSYFGDTFTSDPDLRARLLPGGETTLEGHHIRGAVPGGGSVFIVSTWEGKPAGRLINVGGAATSCYVGFTVPTELRGGGVLAATRNQSEVINAAGGAYDLMVAAPEAKLPATNEVGSHPVRLGYGALTGTYAAYLGSRANPHGGDVWWTDMGLFQPGYDGPAFHGSSGLVKLGDTWMAATWDGEVDNSTSTLRPAPVAVRVEVERSIDNGVTWEMFIESSPLPVTRTDPEALSNGVTLYRVTTYSADDAASVVIHEVGADSPAVWLSGGEGFTQAQRLPYDPAVTITAGRERVVRQYAGRATPVAHAGEAVTRTLDYGGTLVTDEHSPDALAELVSDPAPVHLYRDPDGRHIYGALGTVQLAREAHTVWGFSFQLTETER